MTDDLILALDFGGTKHTAALLRRGERTWLRYERVFSPPGADSADDMAMMLGLARGMLGGRQPSAVGVSFGGPVDAATGVVRLSHHVPGWEDTPLAALLAEALGAPTAVDNDANAAALGEHRYGAGRGLDSLLYVTVSTGVGGGWILNGRLWRGGDGMAGEIGHTVVDPDGPRCLCGKRGCVERLASGPFMAQEARARLAEGKLDGRRLLDLAGDPAAITGKMLAQAAAHGDGVATAVLERGAWALGVALGNAANLVNPERFVLGGGVTKAGRFWWRAARRAARQTALPQVGVDIVPAQLGDDAPLWGAAVLADVKRET